MKKKHLIITACLIAITVITAVTFYINFFYVGDARGGDILYIDRIAVAENLIQLDGGTTSSAEAYKNYEYNIKDEDLYITINYVLVSDAHKSGSFEIKIKDDFVQVKRIYLDDKENKKLIWQYDSATTATTSITLPSDQIVSGILQDGRVGGVLQCQLTADELACLVDYFNGLELTEDNQKEGSTDRDSLSDSTDVKLQLEDGQMIYIMCYLDGETTITYQDGSGYSLYDPELTDYFTVTIAGILKEKGVWN